MIIQYLKLAQSYPELRGIGNVGVGIDIIEKYEYENNISFPQAYKEFLFLAGKQSNLLSGINGAGFPDYKHEQQKYTRETLKEEGCSVEENFWVIADLDGGEQFHFFYFNDPDAEDPENPPVYGSYIGYPLGNKHTITKLANTFQEYIEKKI